MQKALTVLVHGASKAGKSSYAVTCPGPRVYLDVESASRFLAIDRIEWDPFKEDPPVWDGTWDTAVVPTTSWDHVERVLMWLKAGEHPFKSVIIDSISELQQKYVEKESGRAQPTMQQWGSTFRNVSGLIRDLRDLTMHPTKPLESVVLTAMSRQQDGVWRPWVQGQLQTVLPYLLDVVGYLWVETEADDTGATMEVRNLLTRRTPTIEAGERVNGRIPAVVRVASREPGVPGNDIELMINTIFP